MAVNLRQLSDSRDAADRAGRSPLLGRPGRYDYAIAEFERSGFRRPLHSYRALHRFAGLGRAFAGMTIDQPSFFLMGAEDGLNHVREICEAELRRLAPGLKQFVILPEVGHWPHRAAADRTNDLLVTFLNERYR